MNTDENKVRLATTYGLIGKIYEDTLCLKEAKEAYEKSIKIFSGLDPKGCYSSNVSVRKAIKAVHNSLMRISEKKF